MTARLAEMFDGLAAAHVALAEAHRGSNRRVEAIYHEDRAALWRRRATREREATRPVRSYQDDQATVVVPAVIPPPVEVDVYPGEDDLLSGGKE